MNLIRFYSNQKDLAFEWFYWYCSRSLKEVYLVENELSKELFIHFSPIKNEDNIKLLKIHGTI